MNSRERAARRAGYQPPSMPTETPETRRTGRELAEHRDAKQDLQAWLIRAGTVRVLSICALGLAAFWGWKYGWPGILAALIGLWFIRMGKPPPDDKIDKLTGR